ncbi:hypothetical protein SNE40_000137 [Patella caerulea]|uniref:Uncharacterized protein n=1 Tax=Patella caerulea TaxID=87958 RepID=A0AAN8Q9N9_PATCE
MYASNRARGLSAEVHKPFKKSDPPLDYSPAPRARRYGRQEDIPEQERQRSPRIREYDESDEEPESHRGRRFGDLKNERRAREDGVLGRSDSRKEFLNRKEKVGDRNFERTDSRKGQVSRNGSFQNHNREPDSRKKDQLERNHSDRFFRKTGRIPEEDDADVEIPRKGYREADREPVRKIRNYDDLRESDLDYNDPVEDYPTPIQHVRDANNDSFRDQRTGAHPEMYPPRKQANKSAKSSEILRRHSDRMYKVYPEPNQREQKRQQGPLRTLGEASSGWEETSFNTGYDDRNSLITSNGPHDRQVYKVNPVFEDDGVEFTRYDEHSDSQWEKYPPSRQSMEYNQDSTRPMAGWQKYPNTEETIEFRQPHSGQTNGFLLNAQDTAYGRPINIPKRTHKNSEVRAIEALDEAIHTGEISLGNLYSGSKGRNGFSNIPEEFSMYPPSQERSFKSDNEAYKETSQGVTKFWWCSVFMLLVSGMFLVWDIVNDCMLNVKVANWSCSVNNDLEDKFNFTIHQPIADTCGEKKNAVDLLFRIFFGIGPVISFLQIMNIFVIIISRIRSSKFKGISGLAELQIAIYLKELPQVLLVLFVSYPCQCSDESKLYLTLVLASGFGSSVMRYVTAYPAYTGPNGCFNLWWRCLCCKEASGDIKDLDSKGAEMSSCDVPCSLCCCTFRAQASGCRIRCWCYEFAKYLPGFCAFCDKDKQQYGLRLLNFIGLFLLLCALVAQIVILVLLN